MGYNLTEDNTVYRLARMPYTDTVMEREGWGEVRGWLCFVFHG